MILVCRLTGLATAFWFNGWNDRRLGTYLSRTLTEVLLSAIFEWINGINLLEQYNITIFEGARLFLTRSASRNEPLTFNNLGLDRFYTLAYATDQELEDFTNNIVALFA